MAPEGYERGRDSDRTSLDPRTLSVRIAVAALLAAGLLALVWSARLGGAAAFLSWEALLAPYSGGTPLPGGFRIAGLRRGAGRDVILEIVAADGAAAAEVHILPRGAWPGVRESRSFSIGYETPRSPATAREAITEEIAATLRRRDSGLPAPDAIPLRARSDTTHLPWWLTAAGGWRGVFLGLTCLALAWLALTPSRSVVAVAALLGVGDLILSAAGPPRGRADLLGAAMLPLALLFLCVGGRKWRPRRVDLVWAALITILALALRLALGPWGPFHPNGYGPRFVAAALSDPTAIASYGPGYVELFTPVVSLAPEAADWAIFACNALLSALVATLAFALARGAAVERVAAVTAALVLACDPVAIRFAATESYFSPILFSTTLAAVAFVAAGARWARGDGRGAAWCATAAGLLLALATRIHPAAWPIVAVTPLAVCAGGAAGTRRVAHLLAAALFATVGLLLVGSGDVLLEGFSHMRSGVLMRPTAPPSPAALAVAVAFTAICALSRRARRLAPAAGGCVAALVLSRHLYAQSWIGEQTYDRLFVALPLIALAAVATPVLARRWILVPVTALLAVLWWRFALPVASERTTEHHEYVWLRDALAALPRDCRVVHLAAVGNRGVEIPTYVRGRDAAAVGLEVQRPASFAAGFAAAPCLYYVHSSLCSSANGAPVCRAIEGQLELSVTRRTTVPVVASHRYIAYLGNPIEIWIARVDRVPQGGVAPPPAGP